MPKKQNVTALDVESSIFQTGNPYSKPNVMCAVGVSQKAPDTPTRDIVLRIEHGPEPYGRQLDLLHDVLDQTALLVGFNLKFDIAWLRRYNCVLSRKIRVWDCQLFAFLKSNQLTDYPSLEETLQDYGLEGKDRTIEEYWSRGIDTTKIPWEIVAPRVEKDAQQTLALYEKQLEEFKDWPKARRNLFRLQCADLLVLQEIEHNGLYYNCEASSDI